MLSGKLNHARLRYAFTGIFALVVLTVLQGCSTTGSLLPAGIAAKAENVGNAEAEAASETTQCLRFFAALDIATGKGKASDDSTFRVAGYPWLRTNQFLASFATEPLDNAQYEQWILAMAEVDRRAREVEIQSLPATMHQRIGTSFGVSVDALMQQNARCHEHFRQPHLFPAHSDDLRRARVTPSNYSLLQRVLGLYPAFAIPLRWGISGYQKEVAALFAEPLEQLPVRGALTRFVPPPSRQLPNPEVAAMLKQAATNPLGIPLPTGEVAAALVRHFAPEFQIDVATPDDLIGEPFWAEVARPSVRVESPTAYTHLSHLRFDNSVLLRISYVVWFPARPAQRRIDFLAGNLDSIIWRVTLDTDGAPLLFESVHSCGCYHKFYPTERLRVKRTQVGREEPILVPQYVSSERSRYMLRISAADHYITRVLPLLASNTEPVQQYRFDDYQTLKVLDIQERKQDGEQAAKRSLFGPRGIVRGTGRAERFFLWPSGVRSPGAMRAMGTQVVAFVGRREFDDPILVSRYFERAGPGRNE